MDEMLGRGVYRVPYRIQGKRCLIAVDRFGTMRKHLLIPDGADMARCYDWMRAKLDLLDPVPQLHLVNPSHPPAPPRSVPARMYSDPHDPRAYRRTLAKMAANKIPRRPHELG